MNSRRDSDGLIFIVQLGNVIDLNRLINWLNG